MGPSPYRCSITFQCDPIEIASLLQQIKPTVFELKDPIYESVLPESVLEFNRIIPLPIAFPFSDKEKRDGIISWIFNTQHNPYWEVTNWRMGNWASDNSENSKLVSNN